ncbi:peptidoglycan DD-metalloendopeptidase family protein [Salicola sp. Rm-C-2C1-2]|uniref:murein hydrolase activator EnvC family protein n=1 Tax=Salicola sp. Rm-C-2C1-2 TaxID=3141321 RepID=UPI0032E3E818
MRRVVLAMLLGTALAAPAQEDEQAARERLDEVKQAIESVSHWLETARADEDAHLSRLRDAEQAVAQSQKRLNRLNTEVDHLDGKLAELQQRNQQLEAEAERGRETLQNVVRSAWRQGDQPAFQLFFSQQDPGKAARMLKWHQQLGDHTRAQLADLADTLKALERNRQQAQTTREQLASKRDQARQQRDKLQQRRREREQRLTELRARIDERENRLAALREDRQRLEELIEEMTASISSIEAPEDIRPFADLHAKLPWPLKGTVSNHFGDAVGNSGMQANGIRIRADKGTPVSAVHYGRVVFANWLRGFGLMIIIDHGDGYMSLYGNNDTLSRSAGEWVQAGETIARTGNSGGRSQSGLYFEIRHNGQPENPEAWLEQH